MWNLLFLLFCQVLALTQCATFSPDTKQNELRFPYRVNFKYNGILHHNMARVWIVTKFPLPKFEDLELTDRVFDPDCNFAVTHHHVKGVWSSTNQYLTHWMYKICKSVRPHVKLIQEKEKF